MHAIHTQERLELWDRNWAALREERAEQKKIYLQQVLQYYYYTHYSSSSTLSKQCSIVMRHDITAAALC
jgi:hypothetical protein